MQTKESFSFSLERIHFLLPISLLFLSLFLVKLFFLIFIFFLVWSLRNACNISDTVESWIQTQTQWYFPFCSLCVLFPNSSVPSLGFTWHKNVLRFCWDWWWKFWSIKAGYFHEGRIEPLVRRSSSSPVLIFWIIRPPIRTLLFSLLFIWGVGLHGFHDRSMTPGFSWEKRNNLSLLMVCFLYRSSYLLLTSSFTYEEILSEILTV